ncbi:hypothetical protein [Rhizobium grahamii]|uniref:Uncharacterized protein n=1 Tax=Rhizobium grahamii TaxID=1120045 RepID=A0A370KIV3_9HYPH|nr:hypothetical protein [Rhizobium grahamii]RDJ05818.1 hypothetical protein B5K06_25685 [Rhizobium grahamii]
MTNSKRSVKIVEGRCGEAFINGSAELLLSSPPWQLFFKQNLKYWVSVSFDKSKPQRLLTIAYSENGLAFPELTFDALLALAKSNTCNIKAM